MHIDWNGQPGIGAYDQSDNYKAEERKKAFYNDEYKLHVEFPFRNLGENLYKNAPFDVFKSELENTLYSSWDTIKHNVILNWVEVENAADNYGVALFTDHTTSYLQTEELPLGLTVQYVGKALWGRNYRIHGPTHIRYALLPHAKNWQDAAVEFASAAWSEPLIGHFIESPNSSQQISLFETSDKNLHVSAVTVNGTDLFVRFYNTSSENEHPEIHWNCSADAMELVDLNGEKISFLQPEKSTHGYEVTKLVIPQFGFQTIKLTNARVNKSLNHD